MEISDTQEKALRLIAELRNGVIIGKPFVQEQSGMTENEYDLLLSKLTKDNHVEPLTDTYGNFAKKFTVNASILELIHQLDNQPQKDYRKELSQWFFSKPYLIPFWILFLLAPAIVGYITIAKYFLGN